MAKKKDLAVADASAKVVLALVPDDPPTSLPAPPPGIYENVPAEVYHLWDAVSNSRLSLLARSPAHLKAAIDNPKPSTPAQRLGTATHAAVLEPDQFPKRFVTAQRCEALKKDNERCNSMGSILHPEMGWLCGTHKVAGYQMPLTITVLSPENYAHCLGVQAAFRANGRAWNTLHTGQVSKEVCIVWIDEATGLTCKARLDVLAFDLDGGTIVDLKSTVDARPQPFGVSIYKFGYHRQGAMYVPGAQSQGLAINHYGVIAFEKEPPYAMGLYRLDVGAMDAGEVEVRNLMKLYAECLKKNEWPTTPAYSPLWEDISIPSWAFERVFTAEEMGA